MLARSMLLLECICQFYGYIYFDFSQISHFEMAVQMETCKWLLDRWLKGLKSRQSDAFPL